MIERVISKYVTLHADNERFVLRGVCPFHEHKPGDNPMTLEVNPVSDLFECTVCGRGGGADAFVVYAQEKSVKSNTKRMLVAQALASKASLRGRMIQELLGRVDIADKNFPSYASLHEAYGVLSEEISEFFDEVKLRANRRSAERIADELFDIMVVCWRTREGLVERMLQAPHE